MDKDFFEKIVEMNRKREKRIAKIEIIMNPIGFNARVTIDRESCEHSLNMKGIDCEDYLKLFKKHLDKPLKAMLDELNDMELENLEKNL